MNHFEATPQKGKRNNHEELHKFIYCTSIRQMAGTSLQDRFLEAFLPDLVPASIFLSEASKPRHVNIQISEPKSSRLIVFDVENENSRC